MPELPEVETVRRGLEPALAGKVIQNVTLNRADLRIPFPVNMAADLQNKRCVGLRRRGKYLWIDIENGKTLVSHLGMSGSFTINPTKQSKHDHIIITTANNDRIVYNDPRRFGMMFWVETGHEDAHPSFAAMGVEPLGNDFNAPTLMDRLKSKKTPIKTALLDQSVVAGVGNIYACEALYLAGISPFTPANTITPDRAEALVAAIKRVLDDALESGGSSLRDHRQTDGSMGYFQHHFNVYDRAGEKCPLTGDTIIRIVQSGRSTFYCPAKQG